MPKAKPSHQKLAEALKQLQQGQTNGIVQSTALSRIHRERLLDAKFIQEIIKGWYFVTAPHLSEGSTWFGSYWEFLRQYLAGRFGQDYCLSAEASLLLHSCQGSVPAQITVWSPRGDNKSISLPLNTSLFIYQDRINFPQTLEERNGLNVMPIPEALVRASDSFFRTYSLDASILVKSISDPSPILRLLLDQGKVAAAGRIAGAFRALGNPSFADRIVSAMAAASFDVREVNPFHRPIPTIKASRYPSPYEVRLRTMWAEMRTVVLEVFPDDPGLPKSARTFLNYLQEAYQADAYNSLSIEGYQVTDALIERVSLGDWNPDDNPFDKGSTDALAARGYYEAFLAVKESVSRILAGENPSIVRDDHHKWHQALFAPSIQAGILQPSDLAGYRSGSVAIVGSQHVPPPASALMDCMTTLFDLIEEEQSAAVRAVLGHFIFVYVHPYFDGNGRLGRFLMNVMLASGGYDWTTIQLSSRSQYMSTLELASVSLNMRPFAEFVYEEVSRKRSAKSIR